MSGSYSISVPIKYISTDDATSMSTGAVIISGGISVSKKIHTKDSLIIHNNDNDTIKSILTTGTNGSFLVNGNPISGSFDPSVVLNLTNTANSTSTSSGTLIVSGGLGVAKDSNFGGYVNIINTNNSSSTTTGALRVEGGAGLGSLYVEGTTKLNGSLTMGTNDIVSVGKISSSEEIITTLTNNSSSTTTGALQVVGGAGIGQLYVEGNAHINGTLSANTISLNNINLPGTDNSTSISTGTLTVVGGIGIGENVYIGGKTVIELTLGSSSTSSGALQVVGGAGIGSLYVAGTSTLNGASVMNGSLTMGTNDIVSVGTITSSENIITTLTDDATSITTGALKVAGGVGIGKQLHVGGITRIYDTTESTTATTGSLIVDGGLGISKDAFFAGDVTIAQTLTAQSLVYEYEEVIQSTAESTSITTGSVIMNGGVGISKRANIGGFLTIYDTTEASSSSTGSVIIHGGASIAKNFYVNGTSTLNGASVMNGSLTMGTNNIVSVGSVTSSSNLITTLTTGSSSTATGALQVAGGAGLGSLYVNGTSTLNGASVMSGSLTMGTNNIVSVGSVTASSNLITTLTTGSSSTATGALQVAGGAGLGSLYVAGTSTLNGASTLNGTLTSSSNLITTLTTGTSSTTTGALQVVGGAGLGSLYVAGNATFNNNTTAPTQTYRDNSTKVATTAYVDSSILTQNTVMFAPTGFENTTDSIMTYDSTTRVFTIAPTGANFKVWVSGIRYTYSSPIVMPAHAATQGGKFFFYFNDSGVLTESTSFPEFYNSAIATFIYYYSATVYMFTEERHGTVMDPATHFELHNTIGTYYVSGLAASDYTLSPATPTNSHNTFSIATGEISDEQLNSTITALPVGGPYTIMQLSGANTNWFWTLTNTVPFYFQTGSYIQYNQNNAGTWQLTALATNNWVNYYICFTTSLESATQILIVPGQAVHGSLTTAQAESFYNLTFGNLPFVEFLPLYQVTFRSANSYNNTGKCRIEAWTRIIGNKVSITNNVASNHQALSGLQLAAAGVTYGHIDDQPQTIAGIKTFSDTSDATTSTTGGLIVSGGLGISKVIYGGSNIITISTETSSSTATGALQVAGGAGLGSLYVNGTSTLNGASVLNGSLTMGTNNIVSIGSVTSSSNLITTLTTGSSSTATGALQVAGGAGLGSLYVNGTSTLNGASILNGNLTMGVNDIISIGDITSSGIISTSSTLKTTDPTLSSSTTSGALQVSGGAGIGSLYVAGTSTLNGASVLNGSLTMGTNNIVSVGSITSTSNLITTLTTGSSSTATGALQVVGGAGIGSLYVEGTTTLNGASVLNGSLTMGTNNIVSVGSVTSTSNLITTLTDDSSSTTTGALKVTGGAGIGRKLNIGGILSVYDTTQATSTTTGSMIISGGVGIAKDLIVGGDISSGSVSASKSFTGPCTLTDTLNCYKIGHVVVIKFPNKTGTVAVATYFSSTGAIASGFRPTETYRQPIFVTDNNAEIAGSITINTSGDISIYTGSSGNFTLSGTAGFSLNIFYAV